LVAMVGSFGAGGGDLSVRRNGNQPICCDHRKQCRGCFRMRHLLSQRLLPKLAGRRSARQADSRCSDTERRATTVLRTANPGVRPVFSVFTPGGRYDIALMSS
jgi:hypothetical protein